MFSACFTRFLTLLAVESRCRLAQFGKQSIALVLQVMPAAHVLFAPHFTRQPSLIAVYCLFAFNGLSIGVHASRRPHEGMPAPVYALVQVPLFGAGVRLVNWPCAFVMPLAFVSQSGVQKLGLADPPGRPMAVHSGAFAGQSAADPHFFPSVSPPPALGASMKAPPSIRSPLGASALDPLLPLPPHANTAAAALIATTTVVVNRRDDCIWTSRPAQYTKPPLPRESSRLSAADHDVTSCGVHR